VKVSTLKNQLYFYQAIAQSHFLIVNPIQILHKYVIDDPNPIFIIDCQSNPNQISIQLFLEKDIGQQIINGQVL